MQFEKNICKVQNVTAVTFAAALDQRRRVLVDLEESSGWVKREMKQMLFLRVRVSLCEALTGFRN